MVQFIEKHRRLLQAYCLIARILGWLLILGGVFWVFAIVKIVEIADDGLIPVYLMRQSSILHSISLPALSMTLLFLAFWPLPSRASWIICSALRPNHVLSCE